MPEEVNPFAAPQTAPEPFAGDFDVDDQVEATRRKHLKHEASVKSIGTLYYLGSVFAGIVSGALVFLALQGGVGMIDLAMTGIVILVTIVGVIAGHWLRRLDRRARPIVAVMATLGLIQIPVGTLINGYILWLVFSEKGKVVFSDAYKDVIAQTPHIRYRSPTVMIVLLVVVLAMLATVIFTGLFIG